MARLKAIIYTCVSTDRQAEEGTSLEVQESACLRKSQEIGAEVVGCFSDEGVSGAAYITRPGIGFNKNASRSLMILCGKPFKIGSPGTRRA